MPGPDYDDVQHAESPSKAKLSVSGSRVQRAESPAKSKLGVGGQRTHAHDEPAIVVDSGGR